MSQGPPGNPTQEPTEGHEPLSLFKKLRATQQSHSVDDINQIREDAHFSNFQGNFHFSAFLLRKEGNRDRSPLLT